MRSPLVPALSALMLLLVAGPAAADTVGELLGSLSKAVSGPGEQTGTVSGRIIQMVGLMTVLSVAPGLLLVTTSFTRFVIVFGMLRTALGLNQSPPNMVIIALALFMTTYVMQPVAERAWENGIQPLIENTITEEQAVYEISQPLKEFMFANTRAKDLSLFHDVAGIDAAGITVDTVGWRELMPAFIISEIRRAFVIGFMIYLPFLAIDMIIASILMSAGMMMLPPVMISVPFKVIFFVLIDGWYLLAGSLIHSFNTVL